MHHTLEIKDGFKMQDKPGGNATIKTPEKKEYEVIAENGVFKNGKLYAKGEKIMLVEKTATNFLMNNEIKNF